MKVHSSWEQSDWVFVLGDVPEWEGKELTFCLLLGTADPLNFCQVIPHFSRLTLSLPSQMYEAPMTKPTFPAPNRGHTEHGWVMKPEPEPASPGGLWSYFLGSPWSFRNMGHSPPPQSLSQAIICFPETFCFYAIGLRALFSHLLAL